MLHPLECRRTDFRPGESLVKFISDEWSLTLKNLILPVFCKQCGVRLLTEENGYFCPTCWESSPRIERPFCPQCGRPHTAGAGLGTRGNFLCGPCSAGFEKPPYRRLLAAAHYDGAVAEAIKLLKFHDKPRLATALGGLMAEQAANELDCHDYDLLLPVPLHRVRRRARGFNQAELLARHLLPFFPNARLDTSLRRVRPTRVQSRLRTERERRANVKGAFALDPPTHVTGKRVLLIDDVVTTGGTVYECAKVLLNARVAYVDVMVSALALPGKSGTMKV